MFSRFGRIKLGDDDSKPEFSTFSWFAMLFSAGVGIGLLFFSIAEPAVLLRQHDALGLPQRNGSVMPWRVALGPPPRRRECPRAEGW